jgi:hypothetical protein
MQSMQFKKHQKFLIFLQMKLKMRVYASFLNPAAVISTWLLLAFNRPLRGRRRKPIRTMEEQLNFFGLVRHGGSSESEGKRRKREFAEAEKFAGPEWKAKVVGFISPSLLAPFNEDWPLLGT